MILNRILIFVEPGYGIEDILVNLNSMLKDISMNLNRILRISWSASLILVLYLSCIAIVAPVQPSGRDLILWRIYKNKKMKNLITYSGVQVLQITVLSII